MKPAPFDFVRADTLDEALSTLADIGDEARILAGGQSLVAMLNMRLSRPQVLVDIMRIDALSAIEVRRNKVVIGAGVRQADLMRWPDLKQNLPLVAAMLPYVGHAQSRSRGTVCGSLAHADPSAELALACLTLDAEIRLRSRRKRRAVPAADFFLGMMATAVGPDEMIEAVALPVTAAGTGVGFREVARRHGDFAIVASAAIATPDGGHRLAVGGVADVPRAVELPAPDDAAFDEALNEFAWQLGARDDLHASARYRRDLVRRLGRDTMEEAVRCRS
ncbi:FAD binding domain-containing protein [Rhizobium halophytocola]|uniref:2-furoyl-CoA dehydrogenase FAD binding subunit n=1 Tax=Rhizobium halophytocola TaxID=735519 RepID=A0ABS4DUK2_9HYPH|nr:FAD binding domain-containing protein [Rhizobium halophytocola]MBP1849289.1 2-furoyl-CoA dehydrogenase FAD binding subunit [Rhizobium halophytocola]